VRIQTYILKATKKFQNLVKEYDKPTRARIDEAIEKLSSDPYQNTKLLKGRYYGKRTLHAGKLRIIFAICEECRKLGVPQRQGWSCVGCDEQVDKINEP
jgi:mRNA-degrading endonuclease RelE of RelBE toxin-antitoxin system